MKNRFGILLSAILLMAVAIPTIQAQAADDIAISRTKATINIGDILDLDITGTNVTPVWTSYKENIARVDQSGKVTGLRKGSTTIKARVGNVYKTSTVKVVAQNIKLNKKTATIYHGGTSTSTVQLKATVSGATKDVTWESSNPEIASVDEKGKVTSVSAGTATITATANSVSASCVITVKESDILLNMNRLQVSTRGVGSSIKVTPTVTGSKKAVKWTTSDKTIATVSGGKITGKKTGATTVTATANGVSASCEVTVVEGLISINEEKVLLYAGGTAVETKQLRTNAAKTDVLTWTSSDTSVATVTEKGLVTAIKGGTAIISVECAGKTDTCEITVKQTSTHIVEDVVSLKTKGTDKTYTLNKEIIGKSSSVKWATSDKTVATVSGGKITAKKAGTATITATANGVSDTVTVNVSVFDPTIKLNQKQYTLYTLKGNTVTLKATVDGASKTVTWASSNPEVATVSNKGKVTAVNAGETVISASANGVTAQCAIKVKGSSVILDREYITLDKGDKAAIGVDIVGNSQTVTWATTNKKIVTVSKGTVTAKDYGEADIKVTANGVTSICHVKVDNCDHVYDDGVVTTEPTCGMYGVKTYTCTLCGDSYKETLPVTGKHSYEQISAKEADCVTEGFKEYKCSVCSDSYTETIPATKEHSFEWAVVKEAGCVTEGLTAYRCTVCDTVEKEEVITAVGHDWGDWKVITPPTTTSTGLRIKVCSRCGEEEKEEIPQLTGDHEHDYVVIKAEEATCEAGGFAEYECSTCGDAYTEKTDALGHESGEWVVETEPGCEYVGTKKAYCIRCNTEMGRESIPETGHDYELVVNTEPTCEESGLMLLKCKNCGRSKFPDDSYIAPLGHDWEITITKEPGDAVHESVDDFGSWIKTCQRCGEVREQTVINIDIGDGQIKQIGGTFDDEEAYKTLALTNELRTSLGLSGIKELEWEDKFEDIGKIRGAEISYLYSHDRPDGSGTVRYVNGDGVSMHLGENIAASFGHAMSAETAMNNWINSEGHYANLVNAGYVKYYSSCFIDDSGDAYWVQVFLDSIWAETITAANSEATGRIIEIPASQEDADSEETDVDETESDEEIEESSDESDDDVSEQSDTGEDVELSDDMDLPPDEDDIFPLEE